MSLRLNGSTSGYVEIDAPAVAGTTSVTIPATTGELAVKATDGSVDLGGVNIDSSGRLLVGTTSGRNIADGAQGGIQYETTNYGGISITNNRNDASGANLAFGKQRSGSVGGNTIVQNGDGLGAILFGGADGTDLETQGARIEAAVDGTPGANDMPGRLVFSTTADGASSPTERMRIQNNGNVLVGTTNSDPVGNNVNGILLRNDGFLQVSRNGLAGVFNRHGGVNGEVVRFTRNAVDVGSIDVTTTATSYNTSSDYRLKENVTLLTDATDRLKQLPVHRFNFIADPNTVVDGFLAHEAQTVVPECVTGTKDEVDENGDPVYQGIDQSKLVPLLTAALQEAITRIETLEAEVQALKGGN